METILYATDGPVATITLNRPDRLNTIVPPMPDEVEAAVTDATRDAAVKVIVVRGAGRAFCAGYDFGGGFEHWGDAMLTDGRWDPGKDFVMATAPALSPTQKFASVWRSPKPVIAQVHGFCVAGGTDFAEILLRNFAAAVEGREALLVDAASVVAPLAAVDAIYAAADSPLPSYYREWAS